MPSSRLLCSGSVSAEFVWSRFRVFIHHLSSVCVLFPMLSMIESASTQSTRLWLCYVNRLDDVQHRDHVTLALNSLPRREHLCVISWDVCVW